jgi:hypothetical protein
MAPGDAVTVASVAGFALASAVCAAAIPLPPETRISAPKAITAARRITFAFKAVFRFRSPPHYTARSPECRCVGVAMYGDATYVARRYVWTLPRRCRRPVKVKLAIGCHRADGPVFFGLQSLERSGRRRITLV